MHYSVPAYFPISDDLRERLNRLTELAVRMGTLRERVDVVITNISQFNQLEGHVRIHPNEYFSYVQEVERLEELKATMWLIQAEIDQLQVEIMNMIYGSGVAQGGDAQ